MGQIILAVDDKGRFLEYIPKETGHKGVGRRHLAITVLLFNSKGQVLLQKRKHRIFDNIWDLTGATHLLHKPHPCHSDPPAPPAGSVGGEESLSLSEELAYARDPCATATAFVKTTTVRKAMAARGRYAQDDKKCRVCSQDDVDESLEEATQRCLEEEWDISPTSPLRRQSYGASATRLRGVKELGEFNYFAKYNSDCENEHCFLMAGEYDGEVKMNPEMGYEFKWMDKEEFLKDISQNPQNYTPWAVKGAKILQQSE